MATVAEILSLKPNNHEILKLSETIWLRRTKSTITVTRYFKLHNNSRSWAIEANRRVDDWSKVNKRIKECKANIREKREYVIPMHGMTYYV
ncbi:MAG: hypothetical protein VYA60_10685 [Pseudomonadota bacterium]|nr:hypothetical protein [Pseudomonadota bacterium]|tara:strand:- start:1122 stop:1394 length:273 start_codon:yes stop_codon:yes gene_type:complete